MDVAVAVRREIAFVGSVDPEGIKDTDWLLEFGFDSMRMLDLAMALEGQRGIELPDDAISQVVTVGDLVALITSKVRGGAWNRA